MTQAHSRRTRRYGPKIQDYYTVLDVAPNAAFPAIEGAYWKKAFRADPMELELLNEAYEVLGNGEKREAYDAERELNGRETRAGLRDERGQTLAEYSLIITLVAVGVTVTALLFFKTALAGTFDSVTACFTGIC